MYFEIKFFVVAVFVGNKTAEKNMKVILSELE